MKDSQIIKFDKTHEYSVSETINEVKDESGNILRSLYKAFDTELGRKVAIKKSRIVGTDDEEKARAAEKLSSEIAAMLRISSYVPQTPKLYETFKDDEYLYIVMEWIESRTLGQVMNTTRSDDFMRYMIQLAKLLHVLEQKKVFHKDIKPENILISEYTKDLYLIDFNITVSHANKQEGTREYCAPEMMSGTETSRNKSDMFSIGVIMYEYFAKQRPVLGREYGGLSKFGDVKWKKFVEPKEINEKIPFGINNVIVRCMKASPDDRYRDYGELESALKGCLTRMNNGRNNKNGKPKHYNGNKK